MGIRGANVGVTGESRHEHQQRRFREVEVRAEPFDDAKPVARRDEEPRFGFAGAHTAGRIRRGFERAQAGRADGDDPPAPRARRIDGGDGLGRDAIPLGVHPVGGKVLAFDRLERPGADMERDERRRDAGSRELTEHRLVEVQPRRRRRCRTRMARIDRLVARRVRGVGGTRDVGRQRHVAVTLEIIEKRAGTLQPQPEEPSIALDDGRLRVARQQQFSSGFRRMARAKLEHRLVCRHLALEQELHPSAGRSPREEARLDHPRVVEHQ